LDEKQHSMQIIKHMNTNQLIVTGCCCCRVFLYEKTLPGLGGRSLIDGGLADSGATLAHEIGHQLVSDSLCAACFTAVLMLSLFAAE
jgi:hypothetical protein